MAYPAVMGWDSPKVLIIDDDDFESNMMEEALGERFQITRALNGELGLEEIEKDFPDLVLMDLSMPILDGIGTLKRIRERWGMAPMVVVVSSSNEPSDVQASYAGGANAYLVKPGTFDDYLALGQALVTLISHIQLPLPAERH